MKSLRLAIALAGVALVAACSDGSARAGSATALTEPQVRAFVEDVEKATYADNERDVYEPAFADDVRITYLEPGEPAVVIGKDEYLEEVDNDVDYRYSIGAVKVAADGKSATADVSASEAYDADGERYEEGYDQVYRIELRDGAPQVVALEARSTRLSIDGKKQY